MILRGHRAVPEYAFPVEDVRADLRPVETAVDAHPALGALRRWSVEAGGRIAEAAAWTARRPPAAVAALDGYRVLAWNAMDRWMVENEEVRGHLKDPLHRVDVYHSSREVRVVVGGVTVAKTQRPMLLAETGLPVRYYVPREDVDFALEPSTTRSRCAYKGEARYFHVDVGGRRFEDVAWTYPDPLPEAEKVRDLVCFFDERVDSTLVDGEPMPRSRTPWARRAGARERGGKRDRRSAPS